MHFRLDFGKAFGGSWTAKPIRLWLDPFIRETLTEMVVWPNRIVVPMLPEEVTGSLDHLYLRCESAWLPVLWAAHIAITEGRRRPDKGPLRSENGPHAARGDHWLPGTPPTQGESRLPGSSGQVSLPRCMHIARSGVLSRA